MRPIHWLVMIVAALGWGSGGLATRAAFSEGVGPWTMVAMRSLIATLLVVAVVVIRRSGVPTAAMLRLGLVQAVFNLSIPYVLFTFAYDEASAGFVGILAALIPLATAVFANYMLPDEPLTRMKVAGLLVAFSGVAALLLSGDSGLSEGGRPMVAAVLGLVSVAAIGFAGAHAKRHAGTYDPVTMTGMQFGISAVWLVIVMFSVEGAPTDLTATAWWLLALMGVAASFMPFILFFWLLRHVAATDASLIGYLVPFVALIGGIVLLGEQLQVGIIAGGVLVFIGMIIADRSGRTTMADIEIH